MLIRYDLVKPDNLASFKTSLVFTTLHTLRYSRKTTKHYKLACCFHNALTYDQLLTQQEFEWKWNSVVLFCEFLLGTNIIIHGYIWIFLLKAYGSY